MTSLNDLLDFQMVIAYTHPELSRVSEDGRGFEKAYILGRGFEWREQFRTITGSGDWVIIEEAFKKSLVKS